MSHFDVLKFLKHYEQYPCLWDKVDPDFKKREKREIAEEKLLLEFGISTKKELRSKIRNIRCMYNHAVNRIKKSKERLTGEVNEKAYKPKLHWFEYADSFLKKNFEADEEQSLSNSHQHHLSQSRLLPKKKFHARKVDDHLPVKDDNLSVRDDLLSVGDDHCSVDDHLSEKDDHLSVSWNHHEREFCQILSLFRDKEKYCDATLACDEKFFHVHKVVLSVCSDYFDAIFSNTPCKHPVIVLRDIKSEDIEALLSYMYNGIVTVAKDELPHLFKAAEALKIKGFAATAPLPTNAVKRPLDNSLYSPKSDKYSPLSKKANVADTNSESYVTDPVNFIKVEEHSDADREENVTVYTSIVPGKADNQENVDYPPNIFGLTADHSGKVFTAAVCHLCYKSFTSEHELKSHISLHLNENTHKCEFCSFSSAHKDCVKSHTLRTHQEKVADLSSAENFEEKL